MRFSEAVAKRVLETILPGASLSYRPEQSHGEYDFHLQYEDGATAAVEVTAAVDEALAKTASAIRNERRGGPVIRATLCKRSWVIFPTRGACINGIRRDADQHLAKLEREGIDSFYCTSGSRDVRNVCCQLQITFGAAISSDGKPMILIAGPIGAGAVGPSLAIRAGEKEAWKQDNRGKLAAADKAERHLVVYFPKGGLPWTSLTSFVPPSILPKIPNEVTNLWLIGHSEKNENEFVAWRASTNETWRSSTVVCAPQGLGATSAT